MQWISTGWKRLGDISLATWLFGLVPAGLASGLMAGLTYIAGQPAWVILMTCLIAFAVVSWGFAAWRWHRISSIAETSFDDLRARVRDEKLAQLLGERDAENAFQSKVGLAAMGIDVVGSIGRNATEAEEIRKARHQARIKRIESGAEE